LVTQILAVPDQNRRLIILTFDSEFRATSLLALFLVLLHGVILKKTQVILSITERHLLLRGVFVPSFVITGGWDLTGYLINRLIQSLGATSVLYQPSF